jgi:hypothetical protein
MRSESEGLKLRTTRVERCYRCVDSISSLIVHQSVLHLLVFYQHRVCNVSQVILPEREASGAPSVSHESRA